MGACKREGKKKRGREPCFFLFVYVYPAWRIYLTPEMGKAKEE
jgi:hypothetical protein